LRIHRALHQRHNHLTPLLVIVATGKAGVRPAHAMGAFVSVDLRPEEVRDLEDASACEALPHQPDAGPGEAWLAWCGRL